MKSRWCKIFCLTTALALFFLPCTALSQELPRYDAAAGDRFGASASIFVNLAIVGAYGADPNGADSGAAYVYQYTVADGWRLMAKLPNDIANFSTAQSHFTSDDRFGQAVAVYGDYAVVGAPYDDPAGVGDAGAAYVFQKEGDAWHFKARLTPANHQINSEFGASVAIDGRYILVGAPKNDPIAGGVRVINAGAVYVFERPESGWTDMIETARLTASDAQEYAAFGASLSISDDLAVIGAPEMNAYTGAAYVFQRGAAGHWSQIRKLAALNGAPNDRFGAGVAVSGSRIAVGAPYYNSAENDDVGAVYVFTSGSGGWTQSDLLESPGVSLSGGTYVEKGFGYSVGLQNDVAVFGAYDNFNEPDLGHYGNAHLYEFDGAGWAYKETVGDGYGYSADVSDYFVIGGDRERNSRQGDAFVQPKSDTADNLPPVVYGLEDYAIALEGDSIVDAFNIYDLESAADALTLELICPPYPESCPDDPGAVDDPLSCDIDLNGDCEADIIISLSGTGAVRDINIATPAGNAATGTAAVAVRATDEGGATDDADFSVTVNSPPVFDAIGPQQMHERTVDNPSSLDVAFSVVDPETAYEALTLDAGSGNTDLVPDANLAIDKEAGVLRIVPEPDQSGVTTVTLSAVDDVGNVSAIDFNLTVNSLPTIGGLANSYSVQLNGQPDPITFTVSDETTPPENLNVTVTEDPQPGDNPNLLAGPPVVEDGGAAGEKIIGLTVASGESGSLTLVAAVENNVPDMDGAYGVRSQSFRLMVEGTSSQIITDVTEVRMNEGDFSKTVAFDILDMDTPITDIAKIVTSDKDWLPGSKLSLSCPASCTLTIYPPDESKRDLIDGPATITLTVDDNDPGSGPAAGPDDQHAFSFLFNRKPVISPIADIQLNEGAALGFEFTVSDTDPMTGDPVNLDDNVTVKATNVSNPALFADPSTQCKLDSNSTTYTCDLTSLVECSGGACMFTRQLPPNEWGDASIISTVSDPENLSRSESFLLRVYAVNDPPDLSLPGLADPLAIVENSSEFVDIVLWDADGDTLTLTIDSSNTALVPNTIQNLKLCEKTGEGTCASISDTGWVSADSYVLRPDETGDYNAVRLFIRPADYANTELFGDGAVAVSVTDGNRTVTKQINLAVDPVPSDPILKLSASTTSMDDDLDRTTAESSPIGLEIRHPDGQRNLTICVAPPGNTDCGAAIDNAGRVIPIMAQNTYFIDSNGDITNAISISESIQQGETLSLGLVLMPNPNIITETQEEQVKIIVRDENAFSVSGIVTAKVAPVNDPPVITGLKSEYPCQGCELELDPPWLQDTRKTIRFYVDDPDPQNAPESLNVSAQWALGVDPDNAYAPYLAEPVTRDGRVDLVVTPPEMTSGPLSLTVTVSDGRLDYRQDAIVRIQSVNYPPEIVPSSTKLETNEDENVSVELSISDAETARLSKLMLLTEWQSVDPADLPKGTFSGGEITDQGRATLTIQPPPDRPRRLSPPAHARIVLRVQEPDGILSEPVILDLYIQGVPDAPSMTSMKPLDPKPTIPEGDAYTLDFRIEDVDTPVAGMAIEADYDPGITDLELTLSEPVCELETDYRKRCRLTVRGADQSFGEAVIALRTEDDTPVEFQGPLAGVLEAPLVVEEVDDPPSFRITEPLPPPVVTQEDTSIIVYYELSDPDTPADSLQVVGASLNWTWIEPSTQSAPVSLELGEAGGRKYIRITPEDNGFGRGIVGLQATDGANTVSADFDVVVEFVNDAPTLAFTDAPEAPVDEDAVVELTFTVSDVETPVADLILSYSLKWIEGGKEEDLAPYAEYVLVTGTGAEKTLRFTPPGGRPITGKATAIIQATVTDRDNDAPKQDADQAVLEYLAVNDAPVIKKKNGLDVEKIEEDSGPHFVEFIVSDEETLPGNLILTSPVISGDNTALLPEDHYYFDPDFTGSTRRLVLEPADNEWGKVDVTLRVLDAPAPDGLESAPLTFTLDVAPVPDPPTISPLMLGDSPNQISQVVIDEGGTTLDMNYVVEVNDPDTPLSSLIMGAVWGPVPGRENDFVEGEIRFEGTAEQRRVIITPDEYDNGYARITPWVKDSLGATPVKSQPFELQVRPVNNPPVINAPIANPDDIVFTQGDEAYVLRFEVRDVDNPLQDISVAAESGNTDLLPQTDRSRFDWVRIQQPVDNMTHELTMKPLPWGGVDFADVPVTLQASDLNGYSEFTFTLRVFPDVNPPRIRIRESIDVMEDPAGSVAVDFWVWDETKDPWELEVFASSGATDYIPNGSIRLEPIFTSASDPGYSTNANNWRLTFRPAKDAPFQLAEFTTRLIVAVNNGLFEAEAAQPALSVTIHNRNDAPMISTIPNQNVHLNQSVALEFEVDDLDEGPDDLTVTATADPAIADFEYSGIGGNRTLTVHPQATADDQTTFQVTVRVEDNSGVVDPGSGEAPNFAEETFTINMAGVAPGDVDGDGTVGLGDAIAALQVLAGIQPMNLFVGADIDNDGRIGFAEVLNAMKEASTP